MMIQHDSDSVVRYERLIAVRYNLRVGALRERRNGVVDPTLEVDQLHRDRLLVTNLTNRSEAPKGVVEVLAI